ncbi:aconitate hydratase AcnA [Zavarzinella formosa]|uniref:aconitate hydratase AcnA n=1 Tax=Zavarzinella formosa TaxID=360055 RepID=UPI000311FEB8|nr:aconitate hydratase AcnA [Zavarzinella formosa]
MGNSFGSRATLTVGGTPYTIYRLSAVEQKFPQAAKLPYSLKILLENLLRTENGLSVFPKDIEAIAKWDPKAEPDAEIGFSPARVLLQDFTGVPAIVDLAAMRDAMNALGGDPAKINPLIPCELVIDHSVQVDDFGTPSAFENNTKLEYERNHERYVFLRWGQTAFRNFKVVPPETGIVHQVNLEYLARVVFVDDQKVAYPDTLVGTDSHTTMINGVGVLGWGVGGIEAEAAMLGQPVTMLIPQVVGFRLSGKLPQGTTATDLVLTVTQMLRKKGVVGKFVEFFGEGLAELPLADRATIANMAPEYGATCGIFPVDAETLKFLRSTGRPEELVQLVEAYYKEQGLFHTKDTPAATYTDTLELDLSTVVPSLAGPARPQDRVTLKDMKKSFGEVLPKMKAAAVAAKKPLNVTPPSMIPLELGAGSAVTAVQLAPNTLVDGSVVIAAITSCTNTSNPYVLVAAGLLARNAVAKGLHSKPWVKTSLAPGSKVVTDYLTEAGLLKPLEDLKFHVVGYGCTTCIGNSGPLPESVSKQVTDNSLVVASVLSGNRNFEGRVHAEVRANYLASPPLVVAYALAGRVDIDWDVEPVGTTRDGKAVFLKDIWPSQKEVSDTVHQHLRREQFEKIYGKVYEGDEHWQALKVPTGNLYQWEAKSTYIANPPYFKGMAKTPAAVTDITAARVLALLGDSITTDHISPAGNIKKDSPAGKYLIGNGVLQKDFNQYGARRGHHDVMMRGTFANVRLKNLLVPGVEGGVTRHLPDGADMSIFDASMQYQKEGTPLVILAGKEYGSGSSRDWAAKGTKLLGVRAVVAESYERIHRSNLVGMGVLPLQFKAGENAQSLGLTGEEVYEITGIKAALGKVGSGKVHITVKAGDKSFEALMRVDTPQEVLYYEHGGILPYVLRQLIK